MPGHSSRPFRRGLWGEVVLGFAAEDEEVSARRLGERGERGERGEA